MKYGYARVSSRTQLKGNSLEDQKKKLLEEGCTEENIFEEQYTGKTTDRPKLKELLGKIETGDTLVVVKLDRLARSVTEGINLLRDLLNRGIKVNCLNVGLLEDSPMGRFFVATLLAVAELERSMIIERTQSGKEIAKTRPGFKEGRPRIPKAKIEAALSTVANGVTYKQAARIFGISESTLYNAAAKKRLEVNTMNKDQEITNVRN